MASCEVMSAKVTLSDVLTSITVGWRAASASCNAGFSPAGSSTRDPAAAHRAGDRGVVEIVELGGKRAGAVQHPAERVVVEDHGDDRDVLLDRGHQPVHRHRKAAVAAHRDDRPVGMDELGASAAGMAKPIGPDPAACRKPSALLVW